MLYFLVEVLQLEILYKIIFLGAPVIISLPHFLNAKQEFVDNVIGRENIMLIQS